MTDEEFVNNLVNSNAEHIKESDHPESWIRELLFAAIGYAQRKYELDINKACKWLDEQIYDTVMVNGGNGSYDEHIKSEFIRDFKEAMKGE